MKTVLLWIVICLLINIMVLVLVSYSIEKLIKVKKSNVDDLMYEKARFSNKGY